MCGGSVGQVFDDIGSAWNSATSAFQNIVNGITNGFENGVTWISGELNDLGNELATSVDDVLQFIGNTIQSTFNTLATTVADAATTLANAAQNAYDSAEQTFKNIDPTLYADLNNTLQTLGNDATDFLKKYGHAIVDIVADYFCPGSSILIDLLWSEAENGWKPVSLQTLGVAAAESLANEVLPGLDSAVSDILPDVVDDMATGVLNSTVNTFVQTGKLPTGDQLLQSIAESSLGSLPDLSSALENVIPGISGTVEFVQAAQADVTLLEETVTDIQQLTQGQLVALANAGLGEIVSTDGSVTLGISQVLALEADNLSVEAPTGDFVALAEQAQQISSFSAYELDALQQTGVTVISAEDAAAVDVSVTQLNALEADGLTIQGLAGAAIDLTDTASNISTFIAGLGDDQMRDLVAAGINTITADSSVALDVSQAIAAASTGLQIDVPTGDLVSLADSAANLEAMTQAEIEALKGVGVAAIDATGVVDFTASQIEALEAAGLKITGAAEVLADTAADIAALSVQQLSDLRSAGASSIASAYSVALDTLQALALSSTGLAIKTPLGDAASLSDFAASIESLSAAQINALKQAGITVVQAVDSSLVLTVSQISALQAAGMTIEVPSGQKVTITDGAASILNNLAALRSDGFANFSIADSASNLLSLLPQIKAAGFAALTASDTAANLYTSFTQLSSQLGSDNIAATWQVVDSAANLLNALANSDVSKLQTDGVASWIVEDSAAHIEALSAAALTSLVSSVGVKSIQSLDSAITFNLQQVDALFGSAAKVAAPLGDSIALSGTAAAIGSALGQTSLQQWATGLAQAGITTLQTTDTALVLTLAEVGAIADAGLMIVGPGLQLVTLSAPGQEIGQLTPLQIAQFKAAGLQALVSSYGAVDFDVQQVEALELAGLGIASTLSDGAAAIETMTTATIAGLKAAGVSRIVVNAASLALNLAQVAALQAAGVTVAVPAGSSVTVSDLPENITALTLAQIASFKGLGIRSIEASSPSVALDLAQVLAFDVAGVTVSAASNGQVILKDTASRIEAITLQQIAIAGATGINLFGVDDTGLEVNVGQVIALERAGIQLMSFNTDTGQGYKQSELLDTGGDLAALTAPQLSALKAVGVTTLFASDGALTLTAAQAEALESAQVSVLQGATVTLADTGSNISAMTPAQLAGLAILNVSQIEITSGSVMLDVAQSEALAQINVTVAVTDSAANVATLSPEEIQQLGQDGVAVITVEGSPTTVDFSAAQMSALVQSKIQIENSSDELIPLTLLDSVQNLDALTLSEIQQFEQSGVTAETVSDSVANLTALSSPAVQQFENQDLAILPYVSRTKFAQESTAYSPQTQIAALSNGDYAISYNDRVQVFSSNGTPIGNTTILPNVVNSPNGADISVAGGISSPYGGFYQISISGGGQFVSFATLQPPYGATFVSPVHLPANSEAVTPSVVNLGAGNAAASWFNASQGGVTLETEILTSSNPQPIDLGAVGNNIPQGRPAMAALPNGNYVIAWPESQYPGLSAFSGDSGDYGPLAIAFLNGSGQEIGLNTSSIPNVYGFTPGIAANAQGNVLVTYQVSGAFAGVYGEMFNASGSVIKSNFVIAPGASEPSVAALSNGDFVVVYVANGNIYANTLSSTGASLNNEVNLPYEVDNASTEGNPAIGFASDVLPQVTATATGFIVSWDVSYAGGQVPTEPSVDYASFNVAPEPKFSLTDTVQNILDDTASIESTLTSDSSNVSFAPLTVEDTAADIEAPPAGDEPAGQNIISLIADGVQTIHATDAALALNVAQVSPMLGVVGMSVEAGVGLPVSITDTAANIETLTAGQLVQAAQIGFTQISATDMGLAFNLADAEALPIGDFSLTVPTGRSIWLTDTESLITNSVLGPANSAPLTISALAAFGFTDIDLVGVNNLLLDAAQIVELEQAGIYVRVSEFAIGYPPSGHGGPGPIQHYAPVILSDNSGDIEGLTPDQITGLVGIGIGTISATDGSVGFTVSQALAIQASSIVVDVPAGYMAYVADSAIDLENLSTSEIAALSSIDPATSDPFFDVIHSVGTVDFDLVQARALEQAGFSVIALATENEVSASVVLADTAANIQSLTAAEINDLVLTGFTSIEVTDATSAISISAAQAAALTSNRLSIVNASGQLMSVSIVDTARDIEALTPLNIIEMWTTGDSVLPQPITQISATDGPLMLSAAQVEVLQGAFDDGVTFKVTAPPGDGVIASDSAANLLGLTTVGFSAIGITGASVVDSIAHISGLTALQVTELKNLGVSSWTVSDTAQALYSITVQQSEELSAFGISKWIVTDTAADIEALTAIELQTLSSLGVTQIFVTDRSVTLSAAEATELTTYGIVVTVPVGDTVAILDNSSANIDTFVKSRLASRDAIQFTSNVTSLGLSSNAVDSPPGVSLPAGQVVSPAGTLSFSSLSGNAITVNSTGTNPITVELQAGIGGLSATGQGEASVSGNGGANLIISGTIADVNSTLNTLTFQDPSGGGTVLAASVSDGVFTASGQIALTGSDLGPSETLPDGQVAVGGAVVFDSANGDLIQVAGSTEAPLSVTLSVDDGVLTASGDAGAGVSGYGTGRISIEGAAAAVNAALDTLAYQANQAFTGNDVLTVTTTDGVMSVRGQVAVAVPAIDSAPAMELPSGQLVNNQGSVAFDTANGNAIAITAASAETLTAQITVGHGTLAAQAQGAASVASSDAGAELTIVGSAADITSTLQSLTYQSNTGFTGNDNLVAKLNDGAFNVSAQTLIVDKIDGAPVNTVPGPQTIGPSGILDFDTANSNTISVSDPNGDDLFIQISAGHGILAATQAGADGVSLNATGSTLTISGTAQDVNASLQTLSYQLQSGYTGADTIVLSTQDGVFDTVSTVPVSTSVPYSAPSISLAGGLVVNPGATLNFAAPGMVPISVTASSATQSLTTTVSIRQSMASLTALTEGAASVEVSYSGGNSVVTIRGTAHDTNSVLATLAVQAAPNFNGAAALTVTTSDGITSVQGADQLTASSAEHTPGESLPGGQVIGVSGMVTFNSAGNNAITVSDSDNFPLQTQLNVTNGTLSAQAENSAVVTVGNNGESLTVSGTAAAVNATLQTLTYQAAAGSSIGDQMTVVTTTAIPLTGATWAATSGGQVTFDVGANLTLTKGATVDISGAVSSGGTGTGFNGQFTVVSSTSGTVVVSDAASSSPGTYTSGGTIAIGESNVSISNQIALTVATVPPSLALPAGQTLAAGESIVFSTANNNPISVSDAASSLLTLYVAVGQGTLSLSATVPGGVSVQGNGSNKLRISGSSAGIDTVLNGLQYQANANYLGYDEVQIGAAVGNGPVVAVGTIGLSPAVVDLAPAIVVPEGQILSAMGGVGFNTANGNAIAVNAGNTANLQVTITVEHGALSAAAAAGATVTASAASLVIAGSAASVNATLQNLSYQEDAGYGGNDILSIVASDGTYESSNQVGISPDHADLGPGISAPGGQPIGAGGVVAFSAATANAISVSDADGNQLSVRLDAAHGTLSAQAEGSSTVSRSSSGLLITGSVQDINATLNTLVYDQSAGVHENDQIAITASDGTESASSSINIVASSAGPGVALPSGQLIGANGALAFDLENSNAVTVASPAGYDLTTMIAVEHGTLVASAAGAATVSLDGARLTIVGSAQDTNATLATLIYQQVSSYSGPDALTISTTDGLNAASGSIILASSSDAQTINAMDVHEGVVISGTAAQSGQVTIQFFDASGNQVQGQSYTENVVNGSWTVQPNLATLPDGSYSVAATETVSGNLSAPDLQSFVLHQTAPTVSIDQVDNGITIDGVDAFGDLLLTGEVTGLSAGTQFEVNVQDQSLLKSYLATVNPDAATWSALIPAADAELLGSGTALVTAQVTDQFGNPSVEATRTISIREIIVGNGQSYGISNSQTDDGDVALSGGTLNVSSGGVTSGSLVTSGGTESVSSGGTTDATILEGGTQSLSSGGVASGTTVWSGGVEVVNGVVNGASVSSGGEEYVVGGGLASNTILNGGEALVFGTASGSIIYSGGVEFVQSGGSDVGAEISSGGQLDVLSGGIASGTIVAGGGSQIVNFGGTAGATTVSSGGSEIVDSGGVASATTVASGGSQTVNSGGSASDVAMHGSASISGGTLELLSGASGGGPIAFAGSGGVLKIDGPGNDTVSGGAGPNTVDYSNLSTPGLVAIIAGVNGTVNKGGGNGTDTLHHVQDIVDDGMGRANGDVFEVYSGETVTANSANFNYLIELSANVNLSYGTNFTGISQFESNVGSNTVSFASDTHFAYLYGSIGNDTLTVGSGGGYLVGGGGTNVLTGGANATNIFVGGGGGSDTMNGGSGTASNYYYVDGSDQVNGAGAFNALVELVSGVTVQLGSARYQHVQEFVVDGGANVVTVASTDSDVTYLYGGAGNDTLTTGSGGGYLFGEGGTNTLTGGGGVNVFVADGASGVDTMNGGTGNNDYYVDSHSTVLGAGTFNTVIELQQSVTLTLGSAQYQDVQEFVANGGANVVTVANSDANFTYLYGGAGNDTLTTGSGGGYLFGEGGTNTLTGGGGHNIFVADGASGVDTMNGGTGNNDYFIDSHSIVHGAGTFNTVIELQQNVSLTLGSAQLGSDIQQVELGGGTNTADFHTATSAVFLHAGSGTNTLIGGSGNDFLYGSTGTTTFEFLQNWGKDAIVYWASGANNQIDLTALASQGVHAITDLTQTIVAGSDVITSSHTGANSITLSGVGSTLAASSFKFA